MAKNKRKARKSPARRRRSPRRHHLGQMDSMSLMGLGSYDMDLGNYGMDLGQVPASSGLFSQRNLLIAGAAVLAYVLLRKPAGQDVVKKAAETVEKAGEAVKSAADAAAAAVVAVAPSAQTAPAATAGLAGRGYFSGLGSGYYSGWQGQGDPGTAFQADGRGFTYERPV